MQLKAQGPEPLSECSPQTSGLVLGVERQHRQHRAEDFLARHRHAGRDAGHHRRLDEEAAEALLRLASGGDRRTLGHDRPEERQHLAVLRLSRQRAHLGVGGTGVAEPDGPGTVDDPGHERVVHAALHQQP